ncbi:hypothetical protein B0H17DRAFT_1000084 [Mycena rosella]|uniref:RING-type domain-containing protein n=1 Tax=Mycena rosella TaxID=1033263 RepID=A0AAD7H097_MYCRO|nr:hypothetical protein B0H17DRAFT_1000084 [Mycena rosella]
MSSSCNPANDTGVAHSQAPPIYSSISRNPPQDMVQDGVDYDTNHANHVAAAATRVDGAQITEEVLAGKERIVSHEGASQYGGGGIASCGLAGLNFVRVVFGRVEEGLENGPLLQDVLSRRTSEEVISICSRWSSNVHLEVEDIFKVPLFNRALNLMSSTYGEPGFGKFRTVLIELQSIPSNYAAVLITRPPEIITCFKLPIKTESGAHKEVFIIFDSHPRTEHSNGAGLRVNTSLDATASHLDNLLAVDYRLLADRSLQWQTQLLANFSGHYFVPKSRSTDDTIGELTQAVLESSLGILSLQAEVADLKFQNATLSRDRQAVELELKELKNKYRTVNGTPEASPRPSYRQYGQTTTTPPSILRKTTTPRTVTWAQPISGPSRLPSQPTNSQYFGSSASFKPSTPRHESADYLFAKQLQMDINDEDSRPSSASNAGRSKRSEDYADDYMVAAQLQRDWDHSQRDHALKAQAKQIEFEVEGTRLFAERAVLQKEVQSVFECGVCLEKYPEDYVARIADCGHAFCRSCLKQFVVSKLTDKVYPIFCPMCVTDNTRAEPGMITDDLVQMLGPNDKEYQILQELQIASLSILLHCRKCKQSMFVDRAEYDEAPILVCPLPRCNHAWCKACQQTILVHGPEHSCDGSAELEHLMKRRGWKHCPGCKTPFQKSSGCNHMTASCPPLYMCRYVYSYNLQCMSPGCNTHFCYLCGESIVRSALQREIRAAVSAHYNGCALFEDVSGR